MQRNRWACSMGGMTAAPASLNRNLKLAIAVAAMGYFVDIFDLTLFAMVRVASLKDLGLEGEALTTQGVWLLNAQMIGMLLGGIFWGVLGDRLGRVQVLFGSILMYSIANLANAYTHTVDGYALWRFIAGLGLAGEIGAGITLVAELMPREKRGLATTFIAGIGIAGAVFGATLVQHVEWRTSYIVGGIMGLLLLVVRAGVHESGLFKKLAPHHEAPRADLRLLFTRERLPRYIASILIGVPIWYFVGVVVAFSPEIGQSLGTTEPLLAAKGIFYTYLGLTFGDIASGVLSQWLKSRRKAILAFMLASAGFTALALNLHGASAQSFYGMCLLAGFFLGYWALMLTTATEQFGTNIRSTVTATVPNFVRGSTVLLTSSFAWLKPEHGALAAAQLVGLATFTLSVLAVFALRESFGSDLDFVEKSGR